MPINSCGTDAKLKIFLLIDVFVTDLISLIHIFSQHLAV